MYRFPTGFVRQGPRGRRCQGCVCLLCSIQCGRPKLRMRNLNHQAPLGRFLMTSSWTRRETSILRITVTLISTIVSFSHLCAQPPLPSFDVASVKPAPPGLFSHHAAPGVVRYRGVFLRSLLAEAYNLKGFQIRGPSWIDGDFFDIQAPMPLYTEADEVRLMLQKGVSILRPKSSGLEDIGEVDLERHGKTSNRRSPR